MKDYKQYLDYVRTMDYPDFEYYANNTKDKMSTLTSYTMGKVKEFGILDFFMFKFCIATLGMWIGAQFAKTLGKVKGFLFAGFAISWAYLIWRVFLKDED